MDCLWDAYVDHLEFMGLSPYPGERLFYRALKAMTHGPKPQQTFGGVAPWTVERLANLHTLSVETNRAIWKPEDWACAARNVAQRAVVSRTNFGEQVRPDHWISPQIVLYLRSHHAEFQWTSGLLMSEMLAGAKVTKADFARHPVLFIRLNARR